MAHVTDPEPIAFSNNHIRRCADNLAQAYWDAKVAIAAWYASGYGDVFPNTTFDYVEDSAYGDFGDGRPVIAGADVHNIINRLSEIVTSFEADSNAKLNTIMAVAPSPNG